MDGSPANKGDDQSPPKTDQAVSNFLQPEAVGENDRKISEHELEMLTSVVEAFQGKLNKKDEDEGPSLNEIRRDRKKKMKDLQEKLKAKDGIFNLHKKTYHYDKRSLWILHYKFKIRIFFVWLVEWTWFDRVIILLIFLNSLIQAMYDYSDRDNKKTWNQTIENSGWVFTVAFTIECISKILAQGFIIHKKAYLKDPWNWIDFVVVIVSLLELVPNMPNLKALRTMRVLRPLRSIKAVPSMRKLIGSLLQSLPGLANVVVFLMFVFLLFGILGVQQFAGSFYPRCRFNPAPLPDGTWPIATDVERLCSKPGGDGQFQCPAGLYCGDPEDYPSYDYMKQDDIRNEQLISYGIINFDNLLVAMLTIFQALTLEGWVDMMYNLMDSNFTVVAVIYFCMLVVFGSFFLLNLVLAVIMEKFDQFSQQEKKKKMEDEIKLQKQRNKELKKDVPRQDGEVNLEVTQKSEPMGDDLDEGVRVQEDGELESPNTKLAKKKELLKQESKQQLIKEKLMKLGKPKAVKRQDSSVRSETESKVSTSRIKTLKKGKSMYNTTDQSKPSIIDGLKERYGSQDRGKNKSREFAQNIKIKIENMDTMRDQNQLKEPKSAMLSSTQRFKSGRISQDPTPRLAMTKQSLDEFPMAAKAVNVDPDKNFFNTADVPSGESDESPNTRKAAADRLGAPHKGDPFLSPTLPPIGSNQNGLDKKISFRSNITEKGSEESHSEPASVNNSKNDNSQQELANITSLQPDQGPPPEDDCPSEFKSINDHEDEKPASKTKESKMPSHSKKNRCYRFFYHIQASPCFDLTVVLLIIWNTTILALDKYPTDPTLVSVTETMNEVLSWCFFVEMVVKLIGLGPIAYARDKFNLFDCAVVMISFVESIMSYTQISTGGVSSGGAISAFRGIRLLRVFKLARSWKSFQDILIKIGNTVKDISNFSVLLFLFMFTYALLGMEIFAYKIKYNEETNRVDLENGIEPRANFDTFIEAMTTIFIVLIGEDWNNVMYNHVRVMGEFYILFFVTLFIFGNFILLNLFLAILLSNFEEVEEEKTHNEEVEFTKNAKEKTKDMIVSKMKDAFTKKFQWSQSGKFSRALSQSLGRNLSQPVEDQKEDGEQSNPSDPFTSSQNNNNFEIQVNQAISSGRVSSHVDTPKSEGDRVVNEPGPSLLVPPGSQESKKGSKKEGRKSKMSKKKSLKSESSRSKGKLPGQFITQSRNETESLQVGNQETKDGLISRPTQHEMDVTNLDHTRNDPVEEEKHQFDAIDENPDRLPSLSCLPGIEKDTTELKGDDPFHMLVPDTDRPRRMPMPMKSIAGITKQVTQDYTQDYVDADTTFNNKTMGVSMLSDNRKFIHDFDEKAVKKSTQKMKKLDLSYILKDDSKHELPKIFQNDDFFIDSGKQRKGPNLHVPSKTSSSFQSSYNNEESESESDSVKSNRSHISHISQQIKDGTSNALNKFTGIIKENNLSKPLTGIRSNHIEENEKSKIKDISKILVGKSLCIMGPKNCFRRICAFIVKSRVFDPFILAMILFSTILLTLENPLDDPDGKKIYVLKQIDYYVTGVFVFESTIKIIVYGLIVNGKESYLRSSWNVMDIVIVIFAVVSLFPTGINVSFLKILRMLRVLRPLRVVSRNEGLKVAVLSLINAIPGIFNVMVICALFFMLFGIFGTNYFKGQFFYCEMTNVESSVQSGVKNKWDCISSGGEWLQRDLNFDNVLQSMLTLFQMSTTEGWIPVMWNGVDTAGIDKEPVRKNNLYWVSFFILFIVVGSLFILNLFVGVVINTFNSEKDKLGKNFLLTPTQRQWVQIQVQCFKSKPEKKVQFTKNKFRNCAIRIATHNCFDYMIMMFIILNTVVLALKWYGQPSQLPEILDIVNYVFAGIFTFECVVKLIAYCQDYFKNGWNVFDFVIVIGTFLGILVTQTTNLSVGPQTTILRAFRIGRVFRLVKKAKRLNQIFQTFVITIPSLANVGGLLFLLLYLYSVLGVFLFADVKLQDVMNIHSNFQSFFTAFLTLVRCSTGEAWNEIMNDASRQNSIIFQCTVGPSYQDYVDNDFKTVGCGNYAGYLFFISFLLIVSFIFLNLFIAVILEGYSATQQSDKQCIRQTDFEQFSKIWQDYDPNATGFCKVTDLPTIIRKLVNKDNNKLIPMSEEMKTIAIIEQLIAELKIPTYNTFTHYHYWDVLHSLSKYKFAFEFEMKKLKANQGGDDDAQDDDQDDDDFDLEQEDMEIEDFDQIIDIIRLKGKNEKISEIEMMKRYYKRHDKKTEKVVNDAFEDNYYDSSFVVHVPKVQKRIKRFLKVMKQKKMMKNIAPNAKPVNYDREKFKEQRRQTVETERHNAGGFDVGSIAPDIHDSPKIRAATARTGNSIMTNKSVKTAKTGNRSKSPDGTLSLPFHREESDQQILSISSNKDIHIVGELNYMKRLDSPELYNI